MAKAAEEMQRAPGFDMELVNGDLEVATAELIQRANAFLGAPENESE